MNTVIKSQGKFIFSLPENQGYGQDWTYNDGLPLVKYDVGTSKQQLYIGDEMPVSYTKVTKRNIRDHWSLMQQFQNLDLPKTRELDYFQVDEDGDHLNPEGSLYSIEYRVETEEEKVPYEESKVFEEDLKDAAEFVGYTTAGWEKKQIKVTPLAATVHAAFYPEVMLPNKACALTSDQMYDIIRNHIRENIDGAYAHITSDYDFCFTVKKKLKIPTENRTYDANLFSRSKKVKLVKYQVTDREYEIFEMTPESRKYNGYTVISGITADNHDDLKEKLDSILHKLTEAINAPLASCFHCNGTGVTSDEQKISLK
jgi:hypothetical protein